MERASQVAVTATIAMLTLVLGSASAAQPDGRELIGREHSSRLAGPLRWLSYRAVVSVRRLRTGKGNEG